MLPVGAFEIETPETAADVAQTAENTALKEETAETVEMYDSTYGQLVFYSGFNTDNPQTNEIEEKSPIKGLTIYNRICDGITEIGGQKALKIKTGLDGNRDFYELEVGSTNKWAYDTTDVIASGTVYVVSDFYFDNDAL